MIDPLILLESARLGRTDLVTPWETAPQPQPRHSAGPRPRGGLRRRLRRLLPLPVLKLELQPVLVRI